MVWGLQNVTVGLGKSISIQGQSHSKMAGALDMTPDYVRCLGELGQSQISPRHLKCIEL